MKVYCYLARHTWEILPYVSYSPKYCYVEIGWIKWYIDIEWWND